MKKTLRNTIISIVGFLIFNPAFSEVITTESTSKSEATVTSPPPSAISPAITSINSDLCTVGVSGAVQTQILGISGGSTVRAMNCERLKLAKNLYAMGMKVAAVSTLCQDNRVYSAMMNAGTPCPVDGKIGTEAKTIWDANPDRQPQPEKEKSNDWLKGLGVGSSFQGTANTWQTSAGGLFAPTGATSVVGTNGATFYITGVQLEAGSVATPFERRDYGRELIMCQR